ncbi:MAG: undecaprenyl/decaprenyl-phosphate alpha-N-acetylglucosaminyl 1-phosphate transferase, partial [Verrucomicrobiae bacterium]|nr:undecaprenyl/decaprenyl-phosphate alpha-N-acetylglucosaminyl 1-phosphate transferase [Verrucomicrobiae bacterium]
RLVIQAGLALLMVYGGGVVLADVGDAFFVGALTMGFAAAVPFTVFGTVGCINAFNMVDGIDGLSGTIAAATLALIALVAGVGGDGATFLLALALLGGVLGFLWFNLRFGNQHRARVFMGDNGSMTLGLLLCWLLITITQGPNALVPPIVALWIFALPLVDTLSVMFRRMWMGKSPFSPDRNHLHHLLQRAGFRVENTVGIM